jgi:hypothetical protein
MGTLRAAVATGAVTLGGLVGLLQLVYEPGLLAKTREQTEDIVRVRNRYPHPDTVSRIEFESAVEKLATREGLEAINHRLARIEAQLDRRLGDAIPR